MIQMKKQSYHLQTLRGSSIVVANQVIRVLNAGRRTRFQEMNGQSTKWQRMRTYMYRATTRVMLIHPPAMQAVHKWAMYKKQQPIQKTLAITMGAAGAHLHKLDINYPTQSATKIWCIWFCLTTNHQRICLETARCPPISTRQTQSCKCKLMEEWLPTIRKSNTTKLWRSMVQPISSHQHLELYSNERQTEQDHIWFF